MNWVDIAFVITVVLLVFNGLRNGALMSLVGLLSIPFAFVILFFFGGQFVSMLAQNRLPIAPPFAYGILFFATIFILYIIANLLRGVVKSVPLVKQGDTLLGAVIGFIGAWLIWLIVLYTVGAFLNGMGEAIRTGQALFQGIDLSGNTFNLGDFNAWCTAYNDTITNSLFARVNSFFLGVVPVIPDLEPVTYHR